MKMRMREGNSVEEQRAGAVADADADDDLLSEIEEMCQDADLILSTVRRDGYVYTGLLYEPLVRPKRACCMVQQTRGPRSSLSWSLFGRLEKVRNCVFLILALTLTASMSAVAP